ncbi:restriction endonuclease subunit S [Corynebacterium belfantii]|uniref:restriction endonuclease subunit S n=1 Tax=Corynebacterium belfantii TaxID=2014537 RepID=UPI003530FA20
MDASETQKSDVLLTSEAPLGRTAILNREQNVVLGQRLFALRGKRGVLDNHYLHYWLRSDKGQAVLTSHAQGTTVIGIRQSSLRSISVDLPSITTQKAIADVLGALDDKIAANQRVQESGLDLIKALWQKAQRTSTNEVLVGDIIEVNPRTQLADTPEVAFLDMKNLPEDGHLPCTWEMKESRSGSKFLNGDTLLGRITPCFENRKLGYVDFLEEGEAGLGSTEFIVFRPKEDTPRAIPLCIASSDSFRSEAQLNMVGTSGRQRVTADFVKQFPVRWPTAEVLHDFSEATSPLLEKFSLLTKENQVLAATRDELLPLLMNGKITVAEAKEAAGDVGVVKQNQQEEGDGSV